MLLKRDGLQMSGNYLPHIYIEMIGVMGECIRFTTPATRGLNEEARRAMAGLSIFYLLLPVYQWNHNSSAIQFFG